MATETSFSFLLIESTTQRLREIGKIGPGVTGGDVETLYRRIVAEMTFV